MRGAYVNRVSSTLLLRPSLPKMPSLLSGQISDALRKEITTKLPLFYKATLFFAERMAI
jgi:hypothetical protein